MPVENTSERIGSIASRGDRPTAPEGDQRDREPACSAAVVDWEGS